MQDEKNEYGDNYKPHLLEQYKLYVEMADRISSRRQSANSFFLSINTAIITLIGYVNLGNRDILNFYWLVSLAGITLCYMWYRLVRSYKDLNTAKFKVVHEMESRLPFAPYDLEWEKVGKGENPKLYLPFTHIETYIPWVFLIIHAFVFLHGLRIFTLLEKISGK